MIHPIRDWRALNATVKRHEALIRRIEAMNEILASENQQLAAAYAKTHASTRKDT